MLGMFNFTHMHTSSHIQIFSGVIVLLANIYMYSKRASKEDDLDILAGWVGLAWCAADDDHRRESKCSLSGLLVRSENIVATI